MSEIKLYSARACPFAHRTRLVLGEKKLKFELIEIDLANKPAWYKDVSLYGKVPAIEHAGQRIVESAVINEYLDEVFPTPSLLPKEPARRATRSSAAAARRAAGRSPGAGTGARRRRRRAGSRTGAAGSRGRTGRSGRRPASGARPACRSSARSRGCASRRD